MDSSFPELPPGGVLLGVGVDIIEIARIRGVVERQGDRFLQRVFTEEERLYCLARAHPHRHLAARFAAKEAVSKCLSTGIGAELGWKSVSIHHGARSQPLVRLDERGQALLAASGATHVLVSLSHGEASAVAIAALVRAATAG
jgi:holo-[acyl-carrier protein] synthase